MRVADLWLIFRTHKRAGDEEGVIEVGIFLTSMAMVDIAEKGSSRRYVSLFSSVSTKGVVARIV